MYVENHHDDGRSALWCNASAGSQTTLVASDPESFFVPPYVGVRGWVGIRLDRGLDWSIVNGLVQEAFHVTGGVIGVVD